MNRIEEIKEKFKRRSLDESEVEYLLSRLEIAERALERINFRASSYTDHESTKIVLNEMREKSMETLQQIRS